MQSDVQDVDQLLSVDDVCTWFKVTKDWVYDGVEAARMPHIRLGRKHLRFERSQLLGYLEQHGRAAASDGTSRDQRRRDRGL